MSKYAQIYQMADDIFDTGFVYWWQEKNFIVWTCHPAGKGPLISH